MDLGVSLSRQSRLFGRRPAAGDRHCRHPHVGRGDEAAVAGLRRSEGARLGRGACRSSGTVERLVIATNAPIVDAQGERPADPRRRTDGRDRRQRRGNPAGRRSAADPRRRRQRAHHRPHRDRQRRSRQCRAFARPQACRSPTACSRCRTPSRRRRPRVRFRLDGSVPAAAELLRLRTAARLLRRAARSGHRAAATLTAQVTLGMPLKADLRAGLVAAIRSIIDVTNFAAERMVMGQKVEAPSSARQRQQSGLLDQRGDVKINGIPAALDYRKPRDQPTPRSASQATLDEAARAQARLRSHRLCSAGRCRSRSTAACRRTAASSRLTVEADLTPGAGSTICCPAGSSRRASRRARPSRWSSRPRMTRFEDLVIEGARRLGQGHGRGRRLRRDPVGELPGLQSVRRRQGRRSRRPSADRTARCG